MPVHPEFEQIKISDIREPFPGPKALAFLERTRRTESPATATFGIGAYPVVMERGKGVVIHDPDGNVFLDFVAGFGVLNTGHGHPRVVEAVKRQAEKLIHLMGAVNTTRTDLLGVLTEITPGKGRKRVLFGAGGGEAVDMAIRLVRYYGKKYEIFAFYGAYHGRPYGALSLMGRGIGRRGLQPMLPGVVHVPYAYCYRCPFELKYPGCGIACGRFVENAVKGQATGVAEPAAMIVEPLQGNGGMIPAPPEFLQELRRICDENSILLIADEVMSGWGRTGKWFAIEHSGVEPDVFVVGKALGGGLPLSAVIARAEIADLWEPSRDSSTLAGNPVACAAALATIDVLKSERLAENAAAVGAYFLEQLREIADEFPMVGDVRGLGLMLGVEMVKDRQTREPLAGAGRRVAQICLRRGLLIYPFGGHSGNVFGFLPPLIIDRSHVDTAVEIVRKSLAEYQREVQAGGG
jgi:4-aminobutyrate aminotransferase